MAKSSNKGKPKPAPKQPLALTRKYVISDVSRLARVMRWDSRQTSAAETYREAVDIIASAGSGSLDMDRVASGNGSRDAPGRRYAEAAEFLAAVHNGRPERFVAGATLGPVAPILTRHEGAMLERMVGRGQTAREIAAEVFLSTTDKWRGEVTTTVGDALTRLADVLLPAARGRGIRAWASPDESEDS